MKADDKSRPCREYGVGWETLSTVTNKMRRLEKQKMQIDTCQPNGSIRGALKVLERSSGRKYLYNNRLYPLKL